MQWRAARGIETHSGARQGHALAWFLLVIDFVAQCEACCHQFQDPPPPHRRRGRWPSVTKRRRDAQRHVGRCCRGKPETFRQGFRVVRTARGWIGRDSDKGWIGSQFANPKSVSVIAERYTAPYAGGTSNMHTLDPQCTAHPDAEGGANLG